MDASPTTECAIQSFFNSTKRTDIIELWKNVNLMDSCGCHLCCDILCYLCWDTKNRRMVTPVNPDHGTLVTNLCTISRNSCDDVWKIGIWIVPEKQLPTIRLERGLHFDANCWIEGFEVWHCVWPTPWDPLCSQMMAQRKRGKRSYWHVICIRG